MSVELAAGIVAFGLICLLVQTVRYRRLVTRPYERKERS